MVKTRNWWHEGQVVASPACVQRHRPQPPSNPDLVVRSVLKHLFVCAELVGLGIPGEDTKVTNWPWDEWCYKQVLCQCLDMCLFVILPVHLVFVSLCLDICVCVSFCVWYFSASLPAAALPYFRTSAVSAFDSMFKENEYFSWQRKRASIWCVYLSSSEGSERGVNIQRCSNTVKPLFWTSKSYLYFYLAKSLQHRKNNPFDLSDKMRGEVRGNEQSLHFHLAY